MGQHGCKPQHDMEDGLRGNLGLCESPGLVYSFYFSCKWPQFSERTPGSWVEERGASVVWRFWTGAPDDSCPDRQWARRQAAEAQNHIFDR